MNAGALSERYQRAWMLVSNAGTSPLGGPENRTIIASNQIAVLAGAASLGFAAFFLLYETPALVGPAISTGLLVAAYVGIPFANRHGWRLLASIVVIGAPVANFMYLSWFFSSDAGFHLYLLGGGSVAFSVFRTREWALRTVMIVICAACVVYAQAQWHLRETDPVVTPDFIEGWFVVNVTLTVGLFSTMAWFIHRYYIRERNRSRQLLAAAQVAAQTDALTDVYNRRGIAPVLSSVARRGDYALALVDLDRFKRINDRLGHGAGDVVLSNVARTLVSSVGDEGSVARWGGEEFLVVLPGITLVAADALMEQVRADMEEEYGAPDSLARVTVSVGLAHAPRFAGKEEVLRLADANLYEAKSSGRNIVISARLDTSA